MGGGQSDERLVGKGILVFLGLPLLRKDGD